MMTTNTLNFCGSALLALTLSACVLGTKVGDIVDTDSSGEMTDGKTSGEPETGTTGADETGVTGSSTGGPTDGCEVPDGAGCAASSSGGGPDGCAALDEAGCASTPVCQPQLGSAYDFVGCPAGPQFLGCIASDTACDTALTTVCRDGTDEVYLHSDGCIPAGFSQCETSLPLCGACDGLQEPACLADEACKGQYGAPHVEQGGEVCVDFAQPVFLACAAKDLACPPFVPTVCPEGDPETRFDVPSGCIPFGFEICEEGAGTPECP